MTIRHLIDTVQTMHTHAAVIVDSSAPLAPARALLLRM